MGTDSMNATEADAEGTAPVPTQPHPGTLAYFTTGLHHMTRWEVAAVACRVLALWVGYQAALLLCTLLGPLVAAIVTGSSRIGGREWYLVSVAAAAPTVALFAVAVLLWAKAAWLAERMTPHAPEPPAPAEVHEVADNGAASSPGPGACEGFATRPEGGNAATTAAPPNDESVLNLALMVVGVLALSDALPALGRVLAMPLFDRGSEFSQWWSDASWQGQFWGAAMKVVIGVWLLLGSRGVVGLIKRLRKEPYREAAADGVGGVGGDGRGGNLEPSAGVPREPL